MSVTTNPAATGVPASQSAVAITGGTINGATIGATTPAAITGTTITGTGLADLSGAAAGQIKFPATQNASADLNTLDDYDELTSASTPCSGALTDSVQWRLTKIGNVVTLTLPAVNNTSTNVAAIVYGATIPAKYRPPAAVSGFFNPIVAGVGVAVPGLIAITTAGVISLYRDGTGSLGWGTAAGTGIGYAATISWRL